MTEIGQRIRRARLAAGYSQEDLGDLLSMTRAAVSLWEKGRCTPDSERLENLAAMLKVTPAYLLHGEGSPPARSRPPRNRLVGRMARLLAAGLPHGRFDHMVEGRACQLIREGKFDEAVRRRRRLLGRSQ